MHVKEPWRLGKYVSQCVCADHHGEDVIVVEPFGLGGEGPVLPVSVQYANARRIVAAVNACVGISTEVLEKGRVSSDAFQLEESRADIAEQKLEALTANKFEVLLETLPADGLVWVCLNAEGMPPSVIRPYLSALNQALSKAKDEGKTAARFLMTVSQLPGQMQIQALPDDQLESMGLMRTYVAKGLRDEALNALERLVAAAECFGMGSGSDEYATAQAVLEKSRGSV